MTSIEIAPDAAQLYENSSADDRRKVSVLISILIRELTTDSKTLSQIMDEISQRVQERGLTPEILETLLNDDE